MYPEERMAIEAFKAGCCASFASFFGKLSGIQESSTSCGLFLKVSFFLLMVLCNAGVWSNFTKALQHSKSTVAATVTSAATSYIVSAILGHLIFGESVSILWSTGATLVIVGLFLIISDQQSAEKQHCS